jgi:endonuclease/exonuclease/phosphatase family metal-dependent hydrolase
MLKTIFFFLNAFLLSACVVSQDSRTGQAFTIAFYNTENLMDTLDDPRTLDNDFLPKGKYKWTTQRYEKKLADIAKVLSKLGDEDGPELVGLAEVENKKVLQELVAEDALKKHQYGIVHYDSPDKRGIDVALLYKKKSFDVLHSSIYSGAGPDKKSYTRDVLLVKGKAGKDTLHILVNHWPSRRSGAEATTDRRLNVAITVREIVDSILQKNASAKILVMGDFNDEPSDNSLEVVLNAKDKRSMDNKGSLYNPFISISKEGRGTLKHRYEWNLFDQIMMSKGCLEKQKGQYSFSEADIYQPLWLHYNRKSNNGPYRTYLGSDYKGGYSDHFPVYIILTK